MKCEQDQKDEKEEQRNTINRRRNKIWMQTDWWFKLCEHDSYNTSCGEYTYVDRGIFSS